METVRDSLHERRNCAELRQPRYTKTRLFRRIGIADKSDSALRNSSRAFSRQAATRLGRAMLAIIRIFAKPQPA